MKECYKEGDTIQSSTFKIVNELFGEYGLVVLLPDNAELKRQMVPIFKDDLLNQTASDIVEKTAEKLSNAGYKVQANPREVNLFYLKDNTGKELKKVNALQGSPVGQFLILNTPDHLRKKIYLKELE